MGYEVWIYTNEKQSKYRHGSTSLDINVESKPYDGLSKRFKKVTHTIQYTARGDYKKSDYYFYIYNPKGGYYSTYVFRYKHPFSKLKAIDIFFKNDSNNDVPLIFGFNQSNVHVYFTYNYLCGLTNKFIGYYEYLGFLPSQSFREADLLTRLLEEIGPIVKREKKIVIRLNEKPSVQSKYPDSGHFKGKQVTVTKYSEFGFDKYVHTIHGSSRVEQFYFSYERNSIYFENADRSGYLLDKVTVYREQTGSQKPVLFELSFRSKGTYIYTYFDFVKHLKTKGGEAKQIKELTDKKSYPDFQSTLKAESEKLKELITFVKEDGDNTNENISEELRNVDDGTKFIKDVLTPNTNDAKGGSSVGLWKVYNNKLFTLEPGKKIDEGVLTSASITTSRGNTKYKTITIFYALTGDGGRDHKALLLEFDHGISGTKTYFKRNDAEGTTWAETDGIDIGITGGKVTAEVLTQIRTAAGIGGSERVAGNTGSSGQGDRNSGSQDGIGGHGVASPEAAGGSSFPGPEGPAGFSSPRESGKPRAESGGGGGSSTAENQVTNSSPGRAIPSPTPGSQNGNLGATIGGSIAGVGGVGGIAGFGIYRYRHVFLSLIGR